MVSCLVGLSLGLETHTLFILISHSHTNWVGLIDWVESTRTGTLVLHAHTLMS